MGMPRRSQIGRGVVLAGIGVLVAATGWALVCPAQTSGSPRGATRPAATQPTSASGPASRPAASQPASQPRLVTQAEFVKVMQQSCVRCHRQQCSSVDQLRRSRWLTPGKPDASPVFTIIGKGRGKDTYHKLSEADKKIVRDFIQQVKS